MVQHLIIKEVDEANLDDIFKICSYRRLNDPLQRIGIEMKKGWLLEILDRYGPCTKVAYLDGRPVVQVL